VETIAETSNTIEVFKLSFVLSRPEFITPTSQNNIYFEAEMATGPGEEVA
jgi:hypothetical protein